MKGEQRHRRLFGATAATIADAMAMKEETTDRAIVDILVLGRRRHYYSKNRSDINWFHSDIAVVIIILTMTVMTLVGILTTN